MLHIYRIFITVLFHFTCPARSVAHGEGGRFKVLKLQIVPRRRKHVFVVPLHKVVVRTCVKFSTSPNPAPERQKLTGSYTRSSSSKCFLWWSWRLIIITQSCTWNFDSNCTHKLFVPAFNSLFQCKRTSLRMSLENDRIQRNKVKIHYHNTHRVLVCVTIAVAHTSLKELHPDWWRFQELILIDGSPFYPCKNVLVRIRYKIKRIFLSFCVFTTTSHVPTSICNLFNNLANVSTILWTTCALQSLQVHEAMFGTRLLKTQKQKKNNDIPARVISGTRIDDLSAIRYGSVPSQETTAQQASIHFG